MICRSWQRSGWGRVVSGLFHGIADACPTGYSNGLWHTSVQIRESAIESVDDWVSKFGGEVVGVRRFWIDDLRLKCILFTTRDISASLQTCLLFFLRKTLLPCFQGFKGQERPQQQYRQATQYCCPPMDRYSRWQHEASVQLVRWTLL